MLDKKVIIEFMDKTKQIIYCNSYEVSQGWLIMKVPMGELNNIILTHINMNNIKLFTVEWLE